MVRVTLNNVMSNPLMRSSKVERAYRQIAPRSDIAFFSEIAPRYYKRLLQKVFEPKFFIKGISKEIPIACRDHFFNPIHGYIKRTHRGRAGASPNRYFVGQYVYYVPLGVSPEDVILLTDSHYVSGAWNSKKKTFKKWRQKVWGIHHKEWGDFIREAVSRDIPVLGGADFNRVQVSKFHPKQKWLAGERSIDKIFCIESSKIGFSLESSGQFDTPSDHNSKKVGVRIYKKTP